LGSTNAEGCPCHAVCKVVTEAGDATDGTSVWPHMVYSYEPNKLREYWSRGGVGDQDFSTVKSKTNDAVAARM